MINIPFDLELSIYFSFAAIVSELEYELQLARRSNNSSRNATLENVASEIHLGLEADIKDQQEQEQQQQHQQQHQDDDIYYYYDDVVVDRVRDPGDDKLKRKTGQKDAGENEAERKDQSRTQCES